MKLSQHLKVVNSHWDKLDELKGRVEGALEGMCSEREVVGLESQRWSEYAQ